MNSLPWMRIIIVAALLLGFSNLSEGRIKLTAVPERGDTVIRLDNPRATLIEEERVLTLQKGINTVDFSWKGVHIDADSIRLKILSHPESVVLLNVSYPPNEAALAWEISSTEAWEERVRISYLLANIDRLVTYKLLADKAETAVDFKSHLVLRNFSGEDVTNARILLGHGETFEQGIAHEETKQVLYLKPGTIPIEKVWRFDAAGQPWDPAELDENVGIPVSYHIDNTSQSGLGHYALWEDKVRVFQDDGHGSTIFLGEDQAAFVPVGETMKVYIGDSRDIVVTQRKMEEKNINVRRNNKNRTVIYDTEEIIKAEIENFKDSRALLTLVEHIEGEWEMKEATLEYAHENASTIEFEVTLPPQSKKELVMHYYRRNIRP